MRLLRSTIVLAAAIAAGCNRAPQDKDAVRQGVVDYLSKNSGVELGSMDVNVSNVKFEGNKAQAIVEFRPKGMPGQGMSMNYALEAQGKKWVVVKKASGAAGANPHGAAPAGGAANPHGAGQPPASGRDLPEGHPPIQSPGPVK